MGLVLIFLGIAVLSLNTPARDYLFPYAAYLQVSLLLGVFIMLLPVICLKKRPASILFLILFYALFMVALSSSFWSSHHYLVIQRTLLVFGSSLMVIMLVISDPKPVATFRILAKFLALFGGALSLLGIMIYLFGTITILDFGSVQSLASHSLMSQRVYGAYPFLRISSLLGNPNILASWLMVILIMTFYLAFSESRRIFWWVMILIQICALALTFSRAGILATLAGLAIFCYISKNYRWLIHRRTLIMICGFGLIVLATNSVYLPQTDRLSLYLSGRDIIWGTLFDSIINNLALGVGFGVSFEAILEPKSIEVGPLNAFLTVMSELGMLGFVPFLLIWLFPMLHARRKLRSALPSTRLLLATCLAISSAFAINNLFEGPILRFGFLNLIWVYLLTLMVHAGLMEENENYDKE